MSENTEYESIEGEVVDFVGVVGEDQGIQLTAVNIRGESTTELFIEDGEYYLVRRDYE